MQISFASPASVEAGVLVLGVFADGVLSTAAAGIDKQSKGALSRALKAAPKFKGGRDETLSLYGLPGIGTDRVVLFGLGKPDAVDAVGLQRAGGVVAALLNQTGAAAATARLDGVAIVGKDGAGKDGAAAAAAEFAFGVRLRAWRFERYRTTEKPEAKPTLKSLTVQTGEAAAAKKAFARADAVAQGVFLTRELVSEPPNILNPESFAAKAKELAELGIEVEVLGEKQMRKLGMGALLGVGQGSAFESQLVVLQWKGAGGKRRDEAPIAFVGKGVTFDTGGISLKPGQGMWDMKWDMGGAGVVTGLMKGLALRKAKVNAVGVLGLVENMPSGDAQRPGDIVTSMSGQTIEVWNTDAEGRLVLADALWYTQDRFKPKAMINLATLTGAIIIALGTDHAGLFSNDDALAEKLAAAGKAVEEKLWRMPLADSYDKQIDSDIADMKNITGSRDAGSIVAGQFLQRFVNKVPWAHLDIAGTTWSGKDTPTVPKGATAFGVRLLDRLVADNYEG
ncbi:MULTISPECIES: leucyl aminopeptidase [Inquilinus]|uniref:Probable cytosol aminopeptidase n=1 Tax=Inquilinus ginsengisoli TaxID=363840 RepID=A0ABU1JW31_9PROT|nr:leucyl aminopeptidase [Inquilinus ginsengisoli]MDR6292824.1 leucyl aminopeptidase [Inquilinus ginsengisoli]